MIDLPTFFQNPKFPGSNLSLSELAKGFCSKLLYCYRVSLFVVATIHWQTIVELERHLRGRCALGVASEGEDITSKLSVFE